MTRATLLKHFPAMDPCGFCWAGGRHSYRANHRLIDALRQRYQAGESIRSMAVDFDLPRHVITYVVRVPIRQLDFLRRIK